MLLYLYFIGFYCFLTSLGKYSSWNFSVWTIFRETSKPDTRFLGLDLPELEEFVFNILMDAYFYL